MLEIINSLLKQKLYFLLLHLHTEFGVPKQKHNPDLHQFVVKIFHPKKKQNSQPNLQRKYVQEVLHRADNITVYLHI